MKKSSCLIIITFLAVYFFVCEGLASGDVQRVEVSSYTLEDLQNDLNPFMIDCSQLLAPGNQFFKKVELINMDDGINFLMRVSGKLEKNSRLKLTKNRIYYVDSNGFETEKKFDFAKLDIPVGEDEGFIFSIPVTKGKIKIPLTLIRSQIEYFDLVVYIDDLGVLQKSFLKPIISTKIKQQLCFKRRLELSLVAGVTDYNQSIYSYDASLSSFSTKSNTASISFLDSQDQRTDYWYKVAIESSLLMNDKYYYDDFRFHSLKVSGLKTFKNPNWNKSFYGLTFYPAWVLGIAGLQHSKASFIKADLIQSTSLNAIIPYGGIEISILDTSGWLLHSLFKLGYGFYEDRKIKDSLNWDITTSMSRSFDRNYYVSIRLDFSYFQFTYDDNPFLDTSGKVKQLSVLTGFSLGYLWD